MSNDEILSENFLELPDADSRTGSEVAPSPERSAIPELATAFPEAIMVESHGQTVCYVDLANWREVATFLRDVGAFTQCVDITAVDHLGDVDRVFPQGVEPERFELVANYLSHPRNIRMRVISQVPAPLDVAGCSSAPSIVEVFPGIAFAEREVFDLFGIEFIGHDDLTRILMPDDWVGYPLRKDDAPARIPVTFKAPRER